MFEPLKYNLVSNSMEWFWSCCCISSNRRVIHGESRYL